MPRSPKNGRRLIFTTDANSTTSKTPTDAVSSKARDFNKMTEKIP